MAQSARQWVGGGDDDAVDVLAVEDLAEVGVAFGGAAGGFDGFIAMGFVNVGDGGDGDVGETFESVE